MQPLVATAPGKLVLSGEYAVLHGAPALVLAVDRMATCEVAEAQAPGWQFHSDGFDATAQHSLTRLLAEDLGPADPARVCQAVMRELIKQNVPVEAFPDQLVLRTDSRAFYQDNAKLGLGSSAAITVAVTRNLIRLTAASVDPLAVALAAHRSLQSGRGSGLDIATSYHGHTIEFCRSNPAEPPVCVPRTLPNGLHFAFLWTGTSSATVDHLARFASWGSDGPPGELQRLLSSARAVADSLPDPDEFMRQLRHFSDRLRDMDEAGDIGIYDPVHTALADAARTGETLYKPSGAGGGDVGIVVARSADAINEFAAEAARHGATRLQLSMEHDGIEHS